MTVKCYARPVIAMAAALVAGLAAAAALPGLLLPAAVAAAAMAGRIGLRVLRRQTARYSPLLLFFLLGYLSLQPWQVPALPAHHVVHLVDEAKRRYTGTVVSTPRPSGRRVRCVVAVEQVQTAGGDFRPAVGRVRLTVFGTPPALRPGDRIAFAGRMRTFHNFNNPGGFDYRRYMAFQRIYTSTWCKGSQVRRIEKPPPAPLDSFRQQTAELIDAAAGGDVNAVLRTLVLGDRSRMRPDLQAAFRRAGISHLLAISGLHIGIVATAAFCLLRLFFSRFEFFLWRASAARHAAAWAFLPAVLYGIVAGMSPSTQRALIMVGVFLATLVLRKEHDLINTLAVAALIILIIHPPSLFSISFQLSFTAVLGIVCGMRVLLCLKSESGQAPALRRRVLNKFMGFAAVSVFATLGTLPLIMAAFNQVSAVGVAANCVFVPWIGFGAVPPALAATFLAPAFPAAALWLMHASAALIAACLPAVEWLAARSFAAFHTMGLTRLEIACYYAIFFLALAWLHHRFKAIPAAGSAASESRAASGASGRRRWIAAGLILAALVSAGDIFYWIHQRFWCRDLRITVLDVGLGSATLVEMPRGRCMLIDGGGFADNALFDVGASVVAPYLRRRKIRTVDTVVLSHPNSDHLNGLLYIAEHFQVGSLWTNGQARRTLGYRKLSDIVTAKRILHPRYADLPRHLKIPGSTVELLHPPAHFLAPGGRRADANYNDNSIVVKITAGSTSFLFAGDVEADAEAEMAVRAAEKMRSNVLLVPHHGSGTSCTAEWLAAVDPDLAVISVRERAGRKLPHPAVLKRLGERGAHLLRTDHHGAVTLISDGRDIETDWVRRSRLDTAIAGLPLARYWYKRVKW